ncbi:peptide chain release factor N(5)-glutamine methyltransferase [Chromobacterium violaceum]|uniref:Release factor glutamine methyltransferase n=1 Tax=Chromobacterium violaceum TaxID=536 RepID=A0AAX2MC46_CHRVL|nr:peptide chain release factor N(5)-glutamine methyltransferase [Chromobacterium violaceum]OLZ85723.1 protein-(glutamine-N5) methyltransferase, release factor-specific [Chromobacterium violaceum]STB64924.1 Release factor glutamine methyltransferase [Chromobacterium violaceum]SUX33852.1 Release factor glutamine methyltransferase [Chromobacterium violaceum]
MPTIEQALRRHPLPRLESRMLLTHAWPGLTHAAIIGHPERELPDDVASAFDALAARRLAGEPMAYLIGAREFYGRDFQVSPAVLIPRPETEHLVELALARVDRTAPARAVDLGTGSGIIAVTLALEAPGWSVGAVDVSADALAVARSNADALGARVDFRLGSWFGPLGANARFDLIVSNPPYIERDDHHLAEGDLRFEPRGALTDEADGLACLREIAAGAPGRLADGGWLMVEHGYDQGEAVRALFSAAGLSQVETIRDLAGQDRISVGRKAV